jgi:SAM-dependent methyltransferase
MSDFYPYANTQGFWDNTYAEGLVYGTSPSQAVQKALEALRRIGRLEPKCCFVELGCGYGRDLIYVCDRLPLSSCKGIDASRCAVELGRGLAGHRGRISFIEGDATVALERFDWNLEMPVYIYTHYFLQLFDAEAREKLVRLAIHNCSSDGLLILSEYSANDTRFGQGEEVEPGTFVLYPDKPQHKIHFFTEDEISTLSTCPEVKVIYKCEYDEAEEIRGSALHATSWLVIMGKAREEIHYDYL